jgi:hypothetical protein
MARRRTSKRADPAPALPDIPGQELEKAAADVGRDAGRSLIRGIEAVCGAQFAVWIAENRAKAEVARKATEMHGAIERHRALTKERRQYELEEIKHQEKKTLAKRRLDRLLVEMAREQANFETIATRSLRLIEHDPNADKPREVDTDWMFMFVRYAQNVSESDVQELWARILASAVMEDRERLSPAALQLMSLMDKSAAVAFENFCRALQSFGGFFPTHERTSVLGNINLQQLEELGLIRGEGVIQEYLCREFVMTVPSQLPVLGGRNLTQRGAQIAHAIFGTAHMRLTDEVEMSYLRDLISAYLAENWTVMLIPEIDGGKAPYLFQIQKRPSSALPIETHPPECGDLSHQLRQLIEWADEHYLVNRTPRSG